MQIEKGKKEKRIRIARERFGDGKNEPCPATQGKRKVGDARPSVLVNVKIVDLLYIDHIRNRSRDGFL